MSEFKYEGLQGLERLLDATNIFSKEFKGTIWAWVLKAISEAYADGRKAGKADNDREQ